MSENRAKSVVVELGALGVEEKRLKATGYGATKPVGDNKTITGRAKNRRVTLRIMKQPLDCGGNGLTCRGFRSDIELGFFIGC